MDALKTQFEEDLAALAEILVRSDPLPPSHVRVTACAIVRKWLLDGQLNKLANHLGVTFTLPGLDTSAVVSAIERDGDIKFFLTGGVVLDGVPISGFYVSDAAFTGQPALPIHQMSGVVFRPSRYLKAPRVYHDGVWFNVEQIVRYMANKRGGVHFDEHLQHDWERRLSEAAEFFTLGNPDGHDRLEIVETRSPRHHVHLVLPREVGHVWSCLDVELLSVAQALVNVYCNDERLLTWSTEAP